MDDKSRTRKIFEEQFGNIENFSRKAVGSLFENKEDPLQSRPPQDEPPHRRLGRLSDPEAEYEAYLNSASEDNRKRVEREEAIRRDAIRHRDEQLSDLPKSSRRTQVEATEIAARERDEVNNITKPNPKKPKPSLNMRNIVALGLFVVLIIFAVLVWQMVSLNVQLRDSNYDLEMARDGYAHLINENQDLREQIEQLEANLELYRNLNAPPYDDEYYYENGSDDPIVGQPTPTGPRTHTFVARDTLTAVLMHVYGNTARMAEIVALNNIEDPDNIPVGFILILPD